MQSGAFEGIQKNRRTDRFCQREDYAADAKDAGAQEAVKELAEEYVGTDNSQRVCLPNMPVSVRRLCPRAMRPYVLPEMRQAVHRE